MAGDQISLDLGFISVSIGLVAGFDGGWEDSGVMRAMDALLALPGMFLGLVVIAPLGTKKTR